MEQKNTLALIIPTLSRRGLLKRLLESAQKQNCRPHEIIIVDGGPADISDMAKEFPDLNIRCIICRPPSLTRQRNVGLANLSAGVDLVGFVDDDIVLEKGCLENMLKFWEGASPETGGASFNNISSKFQKATPIEYLFGVNSFQSGRILKSGFNSAIASIERTKQVEWLFGGITVWRRRVVEEFKFDEWFTGNAYCDDVDLSYRTAKRYKLAVVKEAKVSHLAVSREPEAEYRFGKDVTRNRIYFVKKNRGFSAPLCYWGCLGLCVGNVVKGLMRNDSASFRRAGGNLAGLWAGLREHGTGKTV